MSILDKFPKRAQRLGTRIKRYQPDPVKQQERTLRKLLRRAAPSAFGQYYNFKKLLRSPQMVEDFIDKVPAHDYDSMYDRWWHMTLDNVENVSWRGRVKYFALSSGTSGAASKHIPVTEDMLRVMRRGALRMFINLPRFGLKPEIYTKGMLMLGGTTSLKAEEGHFLGDLSGINASRIPLWLRPYYKPDAEICRIDDWNERIEEIAKNAPNWDVGFMAGIPAWVQLALEKIIEYHGLATIQDIWPNLTMYLHGGVHFEPYKRSFEKLVGRPLIYLDTYLASEGFFAYQVRPDTGTMKLILNSGVFFEFIPFNENNFDLDGSLLDKPEALTIAEVKEGVDYALLISTSTCGGAWRYLIGDTIRFIDKAKSEIIITGRTKHYLSICGEHLSVENMNEGIQKVEEELDVSIPEFTVSAVESGNFFTHKWYIGCKPLANSEQVRSVLDQRLKDVNDDYATERASVLQDIQVKVIAPDIFYHWQEKQGKMGGQNKFPRVMNKEQFREWEAFVQQHSVTINI